MVHDRLNQVFLEVKIPTLNDDGTWRKNEAILHDLCAKWLDLTIEQKMRFMYELGLSENSLYEKLIIIDSNGKVI